MNKCACEACAFEANRILKIFDPKKHIFIGLGVSGVLLELALRSASSETKLDFVQLNLGNLDQHLHHQIDSKLKLPIINWISSKIPNQICKYDPKP